MWKLIWGLIIMILKPFICKRSGAKFPSICGDKPYFTGLTDVTINQGTDFDLSAGVVAHDKYGAVIPFTVSPSEVEPCQVGVQEFTYTAEDTTKTRRITVAQIADPTISGTSPLSVDMGEEFDPLDGVSAVDGNGNTLTVSVELVS